MSVHSGDGWQLAQRTALPPGETGRRQFFFTLPAQARDVWPAYAPVTKLGVVLAGEEAWGEHNVSSFCGSIVRLDDGRYRMYYTGSARRHAEMWIAVAESADGLAWEKPCLAGHVQRTGEVHRTGDVQRTGHRTGDGQDTNRIVFQGLPAGERTVQPQVVRLPDGRWRMYFWRHHPGEIRYLVAHSTDGLRWQVDDPPRAVLVHNSVLGRESTVDGWVPPGQGSEAEEGWRLKGLRTNDASYIYDDALAGRFEYYAPWLVPAVPDRRVEADNAPHWHRVIHRRLSADGLRWSAPELVVVPDERDPWDQQFYHLAVQWHADWRIGSLGHYRVEAGQQTQDLALAFSRDGRTWHRPLRGGFIPRGPDAPDTPDSMGIYPPNAWIDEGQTWLCLYTGTPLRHNASRAETDRRVSILAARWARDRLVGMAAGRTPGGFLSEPFYPQGEAIAVDADVRGWLRAELCDIFGRKHEGYHLMDAVPVHGDSPAHVLRWQGRDACPFDRLRAGSERSEGTGFRFDAVRLRFEFTEGVVYGIAF